MTRLPARGRTGAKLKENEFADGLRSVRFYFFADFNGCICCKRMPDAGCRTLCRNRTTPEDHARKPEIRRCA